MKILLGFFFITMLIISPGAASSASQNAPKGDAGLEDIAAQALALVQKHKYSEAKQMLTYFEKQWMDARKNNLKFPMRHLRLLSISYDKALKAVTNVSSGHDSRVTAVMQFYLVVDALYSDEDPLWLDTEDQFFASFDKMKQAAVGKDNSSFQMYVNLFLEKYEMIHPAVGVDVKPDAVEQLDSEIRFLMNHRAHFLTDPQYDKHLDKMEKDFHDLFNGTLEDSADPSLPWVILSIGGMITAALVYTGWQKYLFEKKMKQKKVKKRSNDE